MVLALHWLAPPRARTIPPRPPRTSQPSVPVAEAERSESCLSARARRTQPRRRPAYRSATADPSPRLPGPRVPAAAPPRDPGRPAMRAPTVSSELEARVAGAGDLVAAAAVLRDPRRVTHVHPLLARHVAAVVPGIACRVDEH